MEQFSLNKWLQDKSRKVVTRRGNPVRIICTDRKHGEDDLPIVFLEENNGGEFLLTCRNDGRCDNYDTQYDLFFADEEELIDFLPEESGCEVNCTTKSEDLEEEIKSWISTHLKGGNEYLREAIIEWSEIVARHFAKWQKQKDQETIELAEDHAMLAGMNKMKEEMMENAVEGTVKYEIGSAEIPQCDRRYQVLSDPTPIANAKLGDKVKIIIVKTKQQ